MKVVRVPSLFDPGVNAVAGFEINRIGHTGYHTGRAARGDDVARLQGRVGPPGNQFGHFVDHVGGAGVLAFLAVEGEHHFQVVELAHLVYGHQPGAKWTGTVETFAQQDDLVGMLPGLDVARRQVVENGQPGDVVQRFFLADPERLLANDDATSIS